MAEQRKSVEQILKFAAKQKGYKAYVVDNGGYYYGYIITPRDNILSVSNGEFFGAFVSLQYVPTAKNGSACSCHGNKKVYEDHYIMSVDSVDDLVKLEDEGLRYARQLKAKMYKDSNEWLSGYWKKDDLKEVEA